MVLASFTNHFAPLADNYDVLLCDVWGVVHDGVSAFASACEALAQFRHGGGTVILITNAPRPSALVAHQLTQLGASRDIFDGIISSGDVTRSVIATRKGETVFHLGPERDLPIFEGLDVPFASAELADYVVCTGLFDDTTEGPEDYRGLMTMLRDRGCFMVCANPDVVVMRGGHLIYCAGALADLYRDLGGETLYAGKPHRPIYAAAMEFAARARGRTAPPQRVLAIGDSVRTDLTGAHGFGIDFLFVVGGIHAAEFGARDNPDAEALAKAFATAGARPKALMHALAW